MNELSCSNQETNSSLLVSSICFLLLISVITTISTITQQLTMQENSRQRAQKKKMGQAALSGIALVTQGGTTSITAVPLQLISEAYLPLAPTASSEGYDQMTERRQEAQGTMKRVIMTRLKTGLQIRSATPINIMMTVMTIVLYLTISFLLNREAMKIPRSPEANWTELMIRGEMLARGDCSSIMIWRAYTTMNVIPQNCLSRARWKDKIFLRLTSLSPSSVTVIRLATSTLFLNCAAIMGICLGWQRVERLEWRRSGSLELRRSTGL